MQKPQKQHTNKIHNKIHLSLHIQIPYNKINSPQRPIKPIAD